MNEKLQALLSTRTVLVIENDNYWRVLVQSFFEKNGCVSIHVTSGLEENVPDDQDKPDLVAVDPCNAEFRYVDIMKKFGLDRMQGKIPFIFMPTATGEQACRKQFGAGSEGSCLLVKPFSHNDIENAVLELFRGCEDEIEVEPEPPPSMQGKLSELPFPELMIFLTMEKKTGRLNIFMGDYHKSLYWSQGTVVWSESDMETESLGRQMMAGGVVGSDVLEKAQETRHSTGKKLGEVLLEMGAISPHELSEALTQNIRQQILNCFEYREASFNFVDLEKIPADRMLVRLETVDLVIDGIAGHFENFRPLIENSITGMTRTIPLEVSKTEARRYRLAGDEQRIFNQAMSGTFVSEIIYQYREPEKVFRILYTMQCLGLVAISGSTSIPVGGASADSIEHVVRKATDQQKLSGLKDSFHEEYRRLMKSDYFDLLGVSEEESPRSTNDAYRKVLGKYSPDGEYSDLFDRSKRMRMMGQKLRSRIERAYETIIDPDRRKKYVKRISLAQYHEGKSRMPTSPAPSGQSLSEMVPIESPGADAASQEQGGRESFSQGMGFLNELDYVLASKAFARAVEDNPQNGRYYLYLGLSLFLTDSDAYGKRALACLDRALQIDRDMVEAHLFRTVFNKLRGSRKDRIEGYRMLLKNDPENRFAAREINRIKEGG